MEEVKFKISSALKTILGKELITDDFIAVFELVKNSFDASAKNVKIIFNNTKTPSPYLTITDDGKGMSELDIKNKWLFVAYSEKRHPQDYRDKIRRARMFAGAKGIGRFSCDRLGERLVLYTKKPADDSWHCLEVDWSKFEVNSEVEFHTIPAIYTRVKSIDYPLKHGTVLEISKLRSKDWDREKLLLLRRSLERLVNPNQENDSKNFDIELAAVDEVDEDKEVIRNARSDGEETPHWNIVNGKIRNFIFETLRLKTTRIYVEIDNTSAFIKTRLEDRGVKVYELQERNPYEGLHDIRIYLFALNRASKMQFTKVMGVGSREYGSIFLYKNGFRIHPFGNPDDDNLGIDRRHQQGVFRTLGTRDLSGRVEIGGENLDFQETSSRDGGLIKNKAFFALKDLIVDIALKRLEKFVIDLSQFGSERGELPSFDDLNTPEAKQAVFEIVSKLTQSKEVISIEYDASFLNILENRSAESVSTLLSGLKRIAENQNSTHIVKEIQKAEKQLHRLAKAKEEAERAEGREREKAKQAEKEARESMAKAQKAEKVARKAIAAAKKAHYDKKVIVSQNVFLKSALSKDTEHLLTLYHGIAQDALTIEQHVGNLLGLLKNGMPSPEALKVALERISYVSKKITAVGRFATFANHRAAQEELESDLLEYIREYLMNVYGGFIISPDREHIPILFHQSKGEAFVTRFSPVNISIILDNLINNSRKHRAKKILCEVKKCDEHSLIVSFSDDGIGIPRKNVTHLFELGFSTTDGSGLGLYHTKEILTEMNGTINVDLARKPGAAFIIEVPRK